MTTLEIKIDSNSNLYINNHWISINKNNDLEAIFIGAKIEDKIEDKNKDKKVKIIEQLDKKINRKLQAKLIDDEISKFIENDEDVYDDDDDTIQLISNYIYNPETKYINYHENNNNDEEYNEEYEEVYYDINGLADLSEHKLDLSIYEFYYFGSDANDLKYYTRIINDNPIYRISYYESLNELRLNFIGDKIKVFKIEENKETLTLTFLNIKTNITQDI